MALSGNISAPVRVTDLVKASKDAASLEVCTQKIFFVGGCGFCVSDVISRGLSGLPLGGSISETLLETRPQSESFDTLDDLLGFQVQKLQSKLVKIFH